MRTIPTQCFRCLALSCLAILLTHSAVRAQETVTFSWGHGLQWTSPEGHASWKLGGRFQLDHTSVDANDALDALIGEPEFDIRRARWHLYGLLFQRFEIKINYEHSSGDAEVTDVYIGLKQTWGNIRLGHQKESFNLDILSSSNHLPFLEYTLPSQAFGPNRNFGLNLTGSSKWGDASRGWGISWGIGTFYEADGLSFRPSEDDVNITGRLVLRPFHDANRHRLLHVGVAAIRQESDRFFRFRARPEAQDSGRLVDTGDLFGEGGERLGIEALAIFGRFWAAAEFLQAQVDSPRLNQPTFDGAYAQFGMVLSPGFRRTYQERDAVWGRVQPADPSRPWRQPSNLGAWEIAVRYSTLDLTDGAVQGGEQENWTVGLNWLPTESTRVSANWVRADVRRVGSANFLILRWQVLF